MAYTPKLAWPCLTHPFRACGQLGKYWLGLQLCPIRRYEITDQQWAKIAQFLPGKVGDVGRGAIDNRLFINAILWIARSGAPWRNLPERFGPWNSVYRRFRRWAKAHIWENGVRRTTRARFRLAHDRLNDCGRSPTRSGSKKSDPASECLGQSVGGWSTKIHATVEASGNSLRILLSVGQ